MDLLPTILAASEGPAEEVGGIGALGLDPLAILAQAVTFLVLFFIVKKFALEKIVKTLEDRRKTIDKGVHLGIQMQAQQDRLQEMIDQKLQETQTQADAILAETQQEAGAIIKRAETDAIARAENMMADTNLRINDEIRRAKTELEKEMINLVAEATETIIHEKLDAQKDSKLIERALAGVRK